MTTIHESYRRILHVLNVEKHLTIRQITQVLYPNETQDQKAKAYQRVAKALQYLKNQNLLSSKSYGLGKEYLWSLKKHPVITDLGLEAPRSAVHTFKYEHEKLCADVFVALYQTGGLHGWGQKRISKDIIPDRIFWLHDDRYYLEAEKGNQKDAVIQKKVSAYKRFWYDTKEDFQVRFVTDDIKTFQMLSRALKDEPYHYQPYLLEAIQEAVKASNKHSNTQSDNTEQS